MEHEDLEVIGRLWKLFAGNRVDSATNIYTYTHIIHLHTWARIIMEKRE